MNFSLKYPSNLLESIVPAEGPGSGGGENDDRRLVHLAQKGDFSAFDTLVTRHRGKIYAMIVNMVKNDADAWDLSQDAFVKAWKALPRFENRSAFSTWLFRITHNVVYDWMRKRKILSAGDVSDELLECQGIDRSSRIAPKISARPDEAMEQSEMRTRIEWALERLSADHREVILLREVQGMDYKEIAEVQDCTLGTVMSRIFYARKKLQTLLKQ